MTRIVVVGGSGYAGSHIVAEAAKRELPVISYGRELPDRQADGVEYRQGDVTSADVAREIVAAGDVVICAISPRGSMTGRAGAAIEQLAEIAADKGVRLGVIGGAGSLLVAEGGPKLLDTPEFPRAFIDEARELDSVLEWLRASDEKLDWFFVSPAVEFGSHAPGNQTGRYRLGDDLVLSDEDGVSAISGGDLALAVLDEVQQPAHQRRRFTVAD